jgi:hypothetical protein
LEDGASRDGTGSTSSTVLRRSDLEKQELKFRFTCAERHCGDRHAFATSRECLRYLVDHGYNEDFQVYQALVAAANVARHPHLSSPVLDAIVDEDNLNEKMHRYDQSVVDAGILHNEAWPLDTSIADLHRNRTSESKLLLERFCLHCKIKQLQTKADLDRSIGGRLSISLQDVKWMFDGSVIIAFRTLDDMRVFNDTWKDKLGDVIHQVDPYRSSPTNRETTVWFFNFIMEKLTVDRIKSAVEIHGEVLNVHVQQYHDCDTKEVPKLGFVEFKDRIGAQTLLKQRRSFPYRITKATYEVITIPSDAQSRYGTMLAFTPDWKGTAEPKKGNVTQEEN